MSNTPATDLNAILSRYPALLRPLDPPEPLGNAGGLSGAALWRFRSGRGALVARGWPTDGPPRPVVERIHGWLDETGALGFVPVPLRGLDGRTLHEHGGRLWELTPWMPGAADVGGSPTVPKVRAGFAGLAAFHQRLAHHHAVGASPGLLARLREVEGLLSQEFSRMEQAVALRPSDVVSVPARRWIASARLAARGVGEALKRAVDVKIGLQPCLRDVRPDHLLFEGDRLSGLVDFGAMGVDSVVGDLARLASEWLGRDPIRRSSALGAYADVRPIAPAELALLDVFERSGSLLGGGRWVRWHFLEGRAFTDPGAVAHGLERGLERLSDLAGEEFGFMTTRS